MKFGVSLQKADLDLYKVVVNKVATGRLYSLSIPLEIVLRVLYLLFLPYLLICIAN